MTSDVFTDFAASIAELNSLPMQTALQYAALIGDTPEMEEGSDLIVVRDASEAVIARVRLS